MPDGTPKLNKKLQDEICNYLKAGTFIEVVCPLVGVSKSTFFRWLREGKADKSPELTEFYLAVQHAMAMAETSLITMLQIAARDGVWQAACWMLERKYPKRWGSRRLSKQERAEKKELYRLAVEKELLAIDRTKAEIELVKKRSAEGGAVVLEPVIAGTPEYDKMLLEEWGYSRNGRKTVADGKPTKAKTDKPGDN